MIYALHYMLFNLQIIYNVATRYFHIQFLLIAAIFFNNPILQLL